MKGVGNHGLTHTHLPPPALSSSLSSRWCFPISSQCSHPLTRFCPSSRQFFPLGPPCTWDMVVPRPEMNSPYDRFPTWRCWGREGLPLGRRRWAAWASSHVLRKSHPVVTVFEEPAHLTPDLPSLVPVTHPPAVSSGARQEDRDSQRSSVCGLIHPNAQKMDLDHAEAQI